MYEKFFEGNLDYVEEVFTSKMLTEEVSGLKMKPGYESSSVTFLDALFENWIETSLPNQHIREVVKIPLSDSWYERGRSHVAYAFPIEGNIGFAIPDEVNVCKRDDSYVQKKVLMMTDSIHFLGASAIAPNLTVPEKLLTNFRDYIHSHDAEDIFELSKANLDDLIKRNSRGVGLGHLEREVAIIYQL
ncbi:MAG: hypothetical protein WDZ77_02265 [Candidatus Pacearchaeota archaeon]